MKLEAIFNSKNTILHGSPYQNLEIVNETNARYSGKVFGTYNFQRALRYIASMENGGNSVLSTRNRLFVLNAIPQKLLEAQGSVYIVPNETFLPDQHKGEKYDWVYSTKEELKVLGELKLKNVLYTWYQYGVYAVSKELSDKVLAEPNEDTLALCIKEVENLLDINN